MRHGLGSMVGVRIVCCDLYVSISCVPLDEWNDRRETGKGRCNNRYLLRWHDAIVFFRIVRVLGLNDMSEYRPLS